MGTRAVVETGQDRKELIADAGFSRLSLGSVAAGVLTAYGAFALLAGIAAGILSAADVDIDIAGDWRGLGIGGGLTVAGLLFLAYLFGGYVAGRMARRAGSLHGAAVFLLGLVVVALAALFASEVGGAERAGENLRDLGVPTTASEWRDVATVAGIASLAAMLLGALAGGALGERWHTKLLTRALDPNVGAEAEARETAARLAAEAEERRTESIQRVRTTAPTRTARVDSDHETGLVDGPGELPSREEAYTMHPAARTGEDLDGDGRADKRGDGDPDATGNGRFWWRVEPEQADADPRVSTDRT